MLDRFNTLFHNVSVNVRRITISIPEYLYTKLVNNVPARKVSKFVVSAIEKRFMSSGEIEYYKQDPIDDFMLLRDKMPKKNVEDILKAIDKGRK